MPSPVVLVPTMGALHDGHRALLRRGRDLAGPGGSLVVSIFVNPLQFGVGTDLDRYPRDLARDVEICAAEGVAVVFAPLESQMYPVDQTITVHPGPVGQLLEGAFRPGFFEGVLTVVLKIFNLVQPDVAVFGQKDAQQVFLVRRMVADLNLNVDIASVATVREPDGLAAIEPEQLPVPAEPDYRAGAQPGAAGRRGGRGRAGARRGCRGRARRRHRRACRRRRSPIRRCWSTTWSSSIRRRSTRSTPRPRRPRLLLVAATVGKTRLIDNALLTLRSAGMTPPA